MDSERTPLLGESSLDTTLPAPIASILLPPRVHFLDNLRAVLTILLILHHAVLETIAASYDRVTHAEMVLFSLFTNTNSTILWVAFFFVSGYSVTLGLAAKSDWNFWLSRTLKVGLPAFLYGNGGQVFLFLFLASGWEEIFGSYKAAWAFIRLSGPIAYVTLLMALDYIYLFGRWVSRRWPESLVTYTSRLDIRPITQSRFFGLLAISSLLLSLFTFLNCTFRIIPPPIMFYFFMIGYEVPRIDAPVAYIIAYVAGIHFTSVKKYLLPSSSKIAWIALLLSLSASYISMGVAQHLSPSLWQYIRIKSWYENREIFVDGGFNQHTLFFVVWDVLVVYTIPLFLVAAFANTGWTTREWGIMARKTYFLTYIHMIAILVAIYYLRGMENLVLKTVLVGVLGVLGSWAMELPILCILIYRR